MSKKFKKLNPDAKQAWIKTLRSGEYEQGVGALCKVDEDGVTRWCCLGVFADVTIVGYWVQTKGETGARELKGSSHFLTSMDMHWDTQSFLADRNDLDDWDFNQIADWVEENL